MNETVRGFVVFVTVLVTVGIWAPLSNAATRTESGRIVTELYFGILRYLTVRTELKEPDFRIGVSEFNIERFAATIVVTFLLWFVVLRSIRRGRVQSDAAADGSGA